MFTGDFIFLGFSAFFFCVHLVSLLQKRDGSEVPGRGCSGRLGKHNKPRPLPAGGHIAKHKDVIQDGQEFPQEGVGSTPEHVRDCPKLIDRFAILQRLQCCAQLGGSEQWRPTYLHRPRQPRPRRQHIIAPRVQRTRQV